MKIGYIINGIAHDIHAKPITDKETGKEKEIFGSNDRLIIMDEEKRIMTLEHDRVTIYDDWSGNLKHGSQQTVFKGHHAEGKTILTNKRILHYRRPDPISAGLDYGAVDGFLLPEVITAPLKAKILKDQDAYEFCEIPLDDIVKIIILPKDIKVYYAILDNWKRYLMTNTEYLKDGFEIYTSIEEILREKEIDRNITSNSIGICYISPGKFEINNHWKRDDLLKKAQKYEKKGKLDKALIHYQKIIDLFPNDEDTKRKIQQLSSA